MKTVSVLLRGGLGNQLFGWAAGFSLAARLGARLELVGDGIHRTDISVLDPRNFELNYFGMRETKRPRWQKIVNRELGPRFKEVGFDYDQAFEGLRAPVTLDGYFQSWRYFQHNEREVKLFLRGNAQRTTKVTEFLESVGGGGWVGVHVRRSDYLKVDTMALPGADYYKRAIAKVSELAGVSKVVVFTDDLRAAKTLVPGADYYLGPNEMQSPGDVLTSLSYCNGMVGANSSLSWWASFMIDSPDTPRIFPQHWFADSLVAPPDLLPETWLTLPAAK